MTENSMTGAEALQLPPKQAITLFGRSIPVFDYVPVGEAIELEQLMANPPVSGLMQNIEVVAILIRHRLGEAITAADLMNENMGDFAAFEEGVNTLIRPFTQEFLKATIARKNRITAAVEKVLKMGRSTGE